ARLYTRTPVRATAVPPSCRPVITSPMSRIPLPNITTLLTELPTAWPTGLSWARRLNEARLYPTKQRAAFTPSMLSQLAPLPSRAASAASTTPPGAGPRSRSSMLLITTLSAMRLRPIA
ncbi:unnamed protein product, partial [Ectocarpus sp. 12 AP-2014]